MQQFEKWLRSDDERNTSLATMHVLTDTPVDDLMARDLPAPSPDQAWSGWD